VNQIRRKLTVVLLAQTSDADSFDFFLFKQRTDTRQKFPQVDRAGDVFVNTYLQTAYFVGDIFATRDENECRIAIFLVAFHATRQRIAVFFRQIDFGDDQLNGRLGLKRIPCLRRRIRQKNFVSGVAQTG